jgi:Fimbrial assembly protein (PilN)
MKPGPKMSISSTIAGLWAQWARRFDEGMAQVPGLGAWFRPHWDIIIANRDGQFAQLDEYGEWRALGEEQLQSLAKHKRICLRLGEGLGQRRTITLPLAARHDPAATIALSMKQYFPFPEDDTAFAVHGSGQLDGSHQCQFPVSFARRSIIEDILRHMADIGIVPKVVDALGDDPRDPVNADLVSGEKAGGGKSAAKLVLGFCVVLIAIAVSINIWSSLALAPTASALQGQRRPGGTDQAMLQKQAKSQAPSVLNIWKAATTALPDDAYAEYMIYEKGHLRLAGKAKDAAMLVNTIESQKVFRETSFAAASLKEEDGKESFDLTTTVHNEARP